MPGRKARVVKIVNNHEITWEEALEDYLILKKAQGRSERTLKDYQYHVKLFFRRFPDSTFLNPSTLKKNLLRHLTEEIKPASYNNRLVYLKTFFGWCVDEKALPANPLKDIKRRKIDERIVQIEEQKLQELLASPNQKTFSGLRDYALLLLQLDTGIRPKEALSLLISDINLRSYEIYIRAENAKTRVARTVSISPITARAIQKLINVRPDNWFMEIPVFCTCDGRKFSGNGWYKRLSAYGKKLGITFYPYQLRHTFALEFLRNGGNSFALQKTLGHADLNMTKRYVALSDNDMKEQHLKASPVLKLVQESKRVRKLK